MASIVFVVNLVPASNPDWLARQRLCAEALDAVRGEDVLVLNVCYPDEAIERPGWTTLPALTRSADRELGVEGKRKPFVTEILDVAAKWCAERGATAFCYLNNDILVTPELVREIKAGLDEGHQAMVAARTEAAVEEGGLSLGEVLYRGYDVFVFRPDWLRANRALFQPYILGERAWDNAYAAIMLAEPKSRLLYGRGLCLHPSHETSWLSGPYAEHNLRLYNTLDNRRRVAFEAFADTVGLFGLERLTATDLDELVELFFRNQDEAAGLLDCKRVNVAMITHGRLEYTRQAVRALIRTAGFPFSLTVVDNASRDGTREYLLELARTGALSNLVLLDENIGVAKAANLAWALEPASDYYLKLDNDIVMRRPNWLREMVGLAERRSETGALAYNFEPTSYKLYEFKGARFRLPSAGLGGACILIPSRVKRMLGCWCEEYGLYGEEDVDYTARVRLAGLLNCYMEDENAGFHLPAGRAGAIDDVFAARDGREEVVHAEYRQWKDEQRRRNIDLLLANYEAYKARKKSLCADAGVARFLAGRGVRLRMSLRSKGLERFMLRLLGGEPL